MKSLRCSSAGEVPLHLIAPIGPSLQPLAEAVTSPRLDSDWHGLNLAALLVCLMAEAAEFDA